MDFSGLLPIGSVVLLHGGKKRLMVYGVKQTDITTGKEYDYIGVFYPEGNLGDEGHFFFNSTDIEKVSFVGLNDTERQKFISDLEKFYSKNKADSE